MEKTAVALFDFDHTLTRKDSLLPFLFHLKGFWQTLYFLFLLTPHFLAYTLRRVSRQEIKEKIIAQFMKGVLLSQLEIEAREYAHTKLDLYLKPAAIKRLRWHQSRGHLCLIVSASLDLYLIPWAQRQGFEAVLSSQLEVDLEGRVTGRLKGNNCWGMEKKKRIESYLKSTKPYLLYAYGDSLGDQEMLEMADYAFFRTF